MTSRVDDIINLIDNALPGDEQNAHCNDGYWYGEDDGGCVRDHCQLMAADGSDFCDPCRQFMLGDRDTDPIDEQRAIQADTIGGRFAAFREEVLALAVDGITVIDAPPRLLRSLSASFVSDTSDVPTDVIDALFPPPTASDTSSAEGVV